MDADSWLFVKCLGAALGGLTATRLFFHTDRALLTIGISVVIFLALTVWDEYRATVRS